MRAWERNDRKRAPEPLSPARRAHPRGPLHRTSSNQAIGRLLQRVAVVGLPGPVNPKTTYDTTNPGNLVVALTGPINGMPAWINGWLQPHLTAIEASPATYEFDEVADIAWWIVIRELAIDLLRYLQQPRVAGHRDAGDLLRRAYASIEAQRVNYAAAGAAGATYQLFGLTYHLKNQGPNHFYAARPAGTNIEYHGVKRDRVKAIVNHLMKAGDAARYDGDAEDVDDFVCAFLAEPTRWPQEQVFNLLALTRKEQTPAALTGSASPNSLPMAGGTTWDANLNELGRQLPRRALAHAEAEGLLVMIRQELRSARDWNAFLTAMREQLGFS